MWFAYAHVLPHVHSTSHSHCILSLSLSLSQIPSFHVPRADEEWVELLRDMDVERSGAVDRAAWRAYLSALGSRGKTQMDDLIAELLQMERWRRGGRWRRRTHS